MRRNLLVTGATGKQGGALIRAVLDPAATDSGNGYHIYALTRKASGASAQQLSRTFGRENLTVVQGDLEDRESMVRIFEDAKVEGGIWGVFSVMAFPGMGVAADGEERQGKMLADLALEYKVSAFVYSSSLRGGPKYEDKLDLKPTGKAKANVEQHCMALGEKGLPWIILRPGFFMENFDNFIGSIAEAILKKGLKADTTIGLIASEDIGHVAAAVIRNHELYLHKVMVLVSEFPTMTEIESSHLRATGKPMPAVPGPFAWLLVKMNGATQDLIKDIEQNHFAHASGAYPELEGEVKLANEAYKMKTYYEWVLQRKDRKGEGQANWNQVSLGKLLTGRL